ncbi:hypothetical protein EIP91_008112 [Steccherinum ochraceum]|uniref:F-box domain-containing protein n=1 Tax=Steccherinum ochraceum TaxID=92696 RepID=A0A4R0RH59_9APHY|nr:hypothetical protein EIP91_008112 [Steccherinum ochraceum]
MSSRAGVAAIEKGEENASVEHFRLMSLSILVQAIQGQTAPECHKFGILDLPGEIVEKIVVELHDLPCSISAFARTCNHHRLLIYHPSDTFLWRSIFLTQYDDPRLLRSRHRLHLEVDFDFGHAFRERTFAANYLRKVPILEDGSDVKVDLEDVAAEECQSLRALNAVLSLIDTASPISVTVADYYPAGESYDGYWTSLAFRQASQRATKHPPSPDLLDSPSLNTFRYHHAVAHGIPAALLARLRSETIDPEWDDSLLAQALYKLTARHVLISSIRELDLEPFSLQLAMPPLILHKRAYDLSRLRRSRLYGPFVPFDPSPYEWDVDPEDFHDFRVDWAWVAPIAIIMRSILDAVIDNWMPNYRMGAHALRPGAWTPPFYLNLGFTHAVEPKQNRDWAGVEGMWRRLETWLSLPVVQGEASGQPAKFCLIIVKKL